MPGGTGPLGPAGPAGLPVSPFDLFVVLHFVLSRNYPPLHFKTVKTKKKNILSL